ncbi:MAG: DUF1549 domain-containing protein [Planctomycetaceae bacterium]|nr:DUF1549 domain-containing protein [Planctomycetales bacterium]MCB9922959.1 DUF1549 domain-containing protein [Planctomycetaceae bacterium]
MMKPRSIAPLLFAIAVAQVVSVSAADVPLHGSIDRMVTDANLGVVAPLATDGEFLRRLYLDLTGSIPPHDVARAFLEDNAEGKRERMIDRLLGSPQFSRHMANVFDVMLMERRSEKHVKNVEWQKYLYDSISQNKHWDDLVREILAADGTDEKIRPATAFYLTRDGEANSITRDIGRIFFGMDLQCAQCHDHPLISSYYQADYYGIYAFLNRGVLFTDKDKKVFYAEKAEGDVTFTSVFTSESDKTFPRLPTSFEIDEPFFPKGEEYDVAPADKVRPVPKFSRRAKLAELATNGTNRQFNKNIANRLWAHMMGRGLVEPVDLHHADNPPSHPELLELLGDQFVAMDYDVKAFLRELALSATYQRSLDAPETVAEQVKTIEPHLASLRSRAGELAIQVANTQKALGSFEAEFDAAREVVNPIFDELMTASAAIDTTRKAADSADKALADAQAQQTAKQSTLNAIRPLATTTKEAADRLKDAEITGIATQLQARAEKLAAEVATADKAVAAKSPPAQKAREAFAAAKQAADAVKERFDAARTKVREIEPQLAAARQALRSATRSKVLVDDEIRAAEAILAYTYAERVSADEATLENLYEVMRERWANRFSANRLEHLSPEQMAWSVMEATGVIENQRVAAEMEVNKTLPLDPEKAADPDQLAERDKQTESFVYEKTKGNIGTFVKLFGHGDGQPQSDFFATVDQALFFANGSVVQSWLNPSGNNLTARLDKLEEPKAIADEMYISLLTRPPSEAETAEVVAYLNSRPEDKLNVIKEMTWALLTSAEFRFSY